MATGKRFGGLHRLVTTEAEIRSTIEFALSLLQEAQKFELQKETRRSFVRRAAETLSALLL